jgi:hypothetical protein
MQITSDRFVSIFLLLSQDSVPCHCESYQGAFVESDDDDDDIHGFLPSFLISGYTSRIVYAY